MTCLLRLFCPLLGIASGFLIHGACSAEATVAATPRILKVLVAKKQVPIGTRIVDLAEWLEWSEVQLDKVPKYACTSMDQVRDVLSLVDIDKGRILTRDRLMPNGTRALGIRVPQNAELPAPWSHVDVYMKRTQKNVEKEELLLQSVLYLTVDYETKGHGQRFPVVILGLKPDEAQALRRTCDGYRSFREKVVFRSAGAVHGTCAGARDPEAAEG